MTESTPNDENDNEQYADDIRVDADAGTVTIVGDAQSVLAMAAFEWSKRNPSLDRDDQVTSDLTSWGVDEITVDTWYADELLSIMDVAIDQGPSETANDPEQVRQDNQQLRAALADNLKDVVTTTDDRAELSPEEAADRGVGRSYREVIENGEISDHVRGRGKMHDAVDFAETVDTDYGVKVAVRSPYAAKDDIKDLDYDETHREWDAGRKAWLVDVDSVDSAARELSTSGWSVTVPTVEYRG